MNTTAALARYNRYLAEAKPTDPDIQVVSHGDLHCWLGSGSSCYENAAVYSGTPEGVAEAIQQAQVCFADRDYEFKYTAWNMPTDTPHQLEQLGFKAGEPEQVLGLDVPALIPPSARENLNLVELTTEADIARIIALQQGIWPEDFSWLGQGLWREKSTDPQALLLYGIEESNKLVSAAWMRVYDQEIAFFHGGATLPAWRGKGLYRELVNARLRRCRELKLRWAFTEAVPASLPILQKLGFEVLGATRPYFFRR